MLISRRDAIALAGVPEKHFDNYFKSSCEITSYKTGARWMFDRGELIRWTQLKNWSTVELSYDDYKACFEFAFKMAYITNSAHGTGIRGQRSEVQKTDDFILGILAEFGVRRFLLDRFGVEVCLDSEVHPDHITAQDIVGVSENGAVRNPRLNVAVKSSKMKSCWNVIDPLEYEDENRRSEVYIFTRVDLPSDHLFRAVREHRIFDQLHEFLEQNDCFKRLDPLPNPQVWVCGFSRYGEFDRVTSIPGQEFSGARYVKSVAAMHKTEADWRDFAERL